MVNDKMEVVKRIVEQLVNVEYLDYGRGGYYYPAKSYIVSIAGFIADGVIFEKIKVTAGSNFNICCYTGQEQAKEIIKENPISFMVKVVGGTIEKIIEQPKNLPVITVPQTYFPPDVLSLEDRTECRMVKLRRNLTPVEIIEKEIKWVGDNRAFWFEKIDYHHFENAPAIWGGRYEKEIPGPEINELKLKWGYKNGEYLIVKVALGSEKIMSKD